MVAGSAYKPCYLIGGAVWGSWSPQQWLKWRPDNARAGPWGWDWVHHCISKLALSLGVSEYTIVYLTPLNTFRCASANPATSGNLGNGTSVSIRQRGNRIYPFLRGSQDLTGRSACSEPLCGDTGSNANAHTHYVAYSILALVCQNRSKALPHKEFARTQQQTCNFMQLWLFCVSSATEYWIRLLNGSIVLVERVCTTTLRCHAWHIRCLCLRWSSRRVCCLPLREPLF